MRKTACPQEFMLSKNLLSFYPKPLKLIFLAGITTQVEQYFCYQSLRKSFQTSLLQDGRLLWLKPCDPVSSGPRWDSFSSPGTQWLIFPPSQGSTLCALRRCKTIQLSPPLSLRGIFHRNIPCMCSVGLCVCKWGCAIANVL